MQCITLIHAQALDQHKGLKLVRVNCSMSPKPMLKSSRYRSFKIKVNHQWNVSYTIHKTFPYVCVNRYAIDTLFYINLSLGYGQV